MQLTKSQQNHIKSFREALTGARANLVTAGKILVQMLDENENTVELLCRECSITPQFCYALERIGRGQLDPLLLTDSSPAAQRAVAMALPPKAQQQLLTQPIAVVVKDNGGFRVEQKRMAELSAHESCRAIGDGKIRPVDEQKEILQKQIAAQAIREKMRYEILDDKIRFLSDSEFTWSQLCDLADKIKPTAAQLESALKANQVTSRAYSP